MDDPCAEQPIKCFVATRTYTAECPYFAYGDPVTVTRQYTSKISLQDAEDNALRLARSEAEGKLRCTDSQTLLPIGHWFL